MNSCYSMNCASNCCNYYGFCPQNYYYINSYYYNQCWYYYKSSKIDVATIAGAAVGGAFGIFIIIFIICYIRARRQAAEVAAAQNTVNITPIDNTTIVTPSPHLKYGQPMYQISPGFNSSYSYQGYSQQNYGQIIGQPNYGNNLYVQSNSGWNSGSPFVQNGSYGSGRPFEMSLGTDPIVM